MKKWINLLHLPLLLSMSLYSQNEWAETGSLWYYTYWWYEPAFAEAMEIEVTGDTLIQGKACKVFRQNTGVISWSSFCTDGKYFLYKEADQVYFYRDFDQSFHLLYDFGAGQGETWQVPLCDDFCLPYDTLLVMVDSVGMETHSGEQIRVQYTRIGGPEPEIPFKIYENFGGATSMFFLEENCTTGDGGVLNLRCYVPPSNAVINFVGGDCLTLVPVAELAPAGQALRLYPNPVSTTGLLFLEWPEDFSASRIFSVFNCQGSKVIETSDAGLLSLSGLPKGLYFWAVGIGGERMGSGKLVVVE